MYNSQLTYNSLRQDTSHLTDLKVVKKQKTDLYKQQFGQFFTPDELADFCIKLIKNNGNILEPSCGDGAFYKIKKKNDVFIELDKNVIKQKDVLNINFFDYSIKNKFSTVIGNPPFVDNSLFEIKHKTNIKVKANLYQYFIEKCFYHLKKDGEIIFIVPREFLKLTSSKIINDLLYKNGTITHFYDFGDRKFFNGACPNICVFRYEKDNFTYKTSTFKGEFNCILTNGIIYFTKLQNVTTLKKLFDVKVGAVSGADKYFQSKKGIDFVYSGTGKTGKLKKMLYNTSENLEQYKDILIKRKIKKFNENDWWKWGRSVNFQNDRERVYVNCRTRNKQPFFYSKCHNYDGSILALFPKFKANIKEVIKKLNSIEWDELGFMTGGRFIFTQKSLENAPISKELFNIE
ncbi:MAG: class I SAM-dependent methyltransferase [Rickettsiales bacterium]|jgi:adenine-specific DNA-methyltransferase|nr:class I SAM-dependent methyltransferase [Rickettsiales bacterium]